jgi:predicted Zn finger-like uncharacterized protein
MRIQCPACSATYEVADALLDPPRTVRCAQCAQDWIGTPMPESEIAPSAIEAEHGTGATETSHDPEDRPAGEATGKASPALETSAGDEASGPLSLGETPLSAIERLTVPGDKSPARRRNRALTAAWAASFAVLAFLGVAGYAKRDALMQQWPASKRVYATLGLIKPDDKAGAEKPAH